MFRIRNNCQALVFFFCVLGSLALNAQTAELLPEKCTASKGLSCELEVVSLVSGCGPDSGCVEYAAVFLNSPNACDYKTAEQVSEIKNQCHFIGYATWDKFRATPNGFCKKAPSDQGQNTWTIVKPGHHCTSLKHSWISGVIQCDRSCSIQN